MLKGIQSVALIDAEISKMHLRKDFCLKKVSLLTLEKGQHCGENRL